MTRRLTIVGVALAALAIGLFVLRRPAPAIPTAPVRTEAPRKPARPPPPGTHRERQPEPKMPPFDREGALAAFKAAQGKSPGEAAFRHSVKKFLEFNVNFARAQAQKERLTVAEVEELTFFGHMVMATQRPSIIEEMTGKRLSEDQRTELGGLRVSHNSRFKDHLRKLVAEGASESDRWQAIYQAESDYKEALFKLTGLDAQALDGILAGDLAKSGAPATATYPDQVEPRPYVNQDRPRPAGPGR